MSTIYMAQYERNEAMRRARNAAFLRDANVVTSASEGFAAATKVYVRNARRWNHKLLSLRRVRRRAESVGRNVDGCMRGRYCPTHGGFHED